MKKQIVNIALFLVVLVLSVQANANHILGGEVSYKHIANKKYKVIVKVYRDCGECKFNGVGGGSSSENCQDSFNLVVYNLDNNRSYVDDIVLVRDSFKDITPVCSSVKSLCGGTTGINYGIEAHWFSCVVDFSTYINACNFELGTQIYSRSNEIHHNQETQHYYNNSVLNLCKINNNNSAVTQASPLQILYTNEPVRYNIEAMDPDGDSLSYELVKAKISPELFIQYPPGKNEKEPLTPYCPPQCTINKYANPPTGIYFNTRTGELVFTPFKEDESGIFVIQVNEWRKVNGVMTKIGEVRSDVQFYVSKNSGNASPKMMNDDFEFEICANEDLCIDFNATDTKTGVAYDTVSFTCFSAVQNFYFKENAFRNPPYKSASFCWTPTNLDARNEPYYFTIKMEDNGCPMRKTSYHTFSVKVSKSVQAKATVDNIGCGELILNSTSEDGPTFSNYWQIDDYKDSTLAYLFKKDTTWIANKNGVYRYTFVHSNTNSGCNSNIQDSIVVSNISDIQVDLGTDIQRCLGVEQSIYPSVTGASGALSYLWENGSTMAYQEVKIDSSILKKVLVVDENSCVAYDSITLSPYPRLRTKIANQEICFKNDKLNLTDLFKDASMARQFTFKTNGYDTVALSHDNDQWYLDYSKFSAPKVYHLYLQVEDQYNCRYLDSFQIKVSDPPSIKFSEIRDLCANEKEVHLNRETQNDLPGKWSYLPNPLRITNNDVLNIEGMDLNYTYSVHFYYEDKGCVIDKNFGFVIKDIPEVKIEYPTENSICVSSDSLICKSNIQGGYWTGFGMRDSVFLPSSVSQSKTLISYFYKNKNTGCSNSDTLLMHMIKEPKFSFSKSSDTICEGGQTFVDFSYSNQKKVEIKSIPNGVFGSDLNKVLFNHKNFPEVFYVECIGISSNGVCPDMGDTFALYVNQIPKGNLEADVMSGCEPLDIHFSLTNLNHPFNQLKTELIGRNALTHEMTANQLSEGLYDYKLVADYQGCLDTLELEGVTVFSSPIADFSINPDLIFADNPIVYYKDLTHCSDPYNLSWDFEGKIDSNNYKEDIIIRYPDEPAKYYTSLLVESINGCEDKVEKELEILPSRELHIPTAFTPNHLGPGVNERFKVVSSVIGSYKIVILNRWGEMVYTSHDINESWDGTYNNKPCKPGVYAYKIVVNRNDGYTKEYNGTITLLRSGE